jgi:hypothetical protein
MNGISCGMAKMQILSEGNMEKKLKTAEKLKCEKYARAKILHVNRVLLFLFHSITFI